MAQRTSSGVTYLHSDHLGSTVETTGITTTEQLHFPYGAQRTTEEVAAEYRYTGQRWEEAIGLYDYKARWYDAEQAKLAGLPLPEIEDADGCVTVRFRRSRYLPPQRVGRDVTERQQAILALLDQAGEGLALREILSRLEMPASERQVREYLAILRTLGLALPEGHGRGAHWRRL